MFKSEYERLFVKLLHLRQQIEGWGSKADANEYLQYLHKHFNDHDISVLKEGGAIPSTYKLEDYQHS